MREVFCHEFRPSAWSDMRRPNKYHWLIFILPDHWMLRGEWLPHGWRPCTGCKFRNRTSYASVRDFPAFITKNRKDYHLFINLLKSSTLATLQNPNTYDNIKGKGLPITDHEGPDGEQTYRSILSSTSALDGGVGGQRHAPAALPPGENGTHCIGDWVGPRAGLDGCGKSRPHSW